MMRVAKKLLHGVASLELTLVLLALAVAILLYGRAMDEYQDWLIALPLCGLTVNLIAALMVNRMLRIQGGLLIFHLSLAALAGIAAVGQLIQMEGHVEITEGSAFDANQVVVEKAPFHNLKLDRVNFIQGDFDINYAPGMNRRDTISNIEFIGLNGAKQNLKVGDDQPLVAQGYRFYTTFNKGFAPLLTYENKSGNRMVGTVHLPSYPLFDYKQMNEWRPPGSQQDVKLWLRPGQDLYDEDRSWRFSKPDDPVLVVIEGKRRQEIKTGEMVNLSSGKLRFAGLKTWMGYKIRYNPTTPWLFAASIIAVLGLLWHMIRKFMATPWNGKELDRGQADVG